MGHQLHTQRKTAPAALNPSSLATPRQYKSGSYGVGQPQLSSIQAKLGQSLEEIPAYQSKNSSLQDQIDRATRFGHSLNRVQVYPSPVASTPSTTLSTTPSTAPSTSGNIQRQAVSRQPAHTSNTHLYVQRQVVEEERKRDEESESQQMKSEDQPIQGFFLGMILGAVLPKIFKFLFPGGGGGGGGGGGADSSGGGGAGGGGTER